MDDENGNENGELTSRAPTQADLLFLRQQYSDEVSGTN